MMFAYAGSFNYTGSEGIHICQYDDVHGSLKYLRTVLPEINPGSITICDGLLYATDEREAGLVYTFRIDPKSGDIEKIQCTDTLAVNPSHVTIDYNKRYALVSHFSVGAPIRRIEKDDHGLFISRWYQNDSATCLYRFDPEHGLGDLLDIGLHRDSGSFMTMVHKAFVRPGYNCYAENDLGGNSVYLFKIEDNKLIYTTSLKIAEGDEGPRHGVFHPTLPYLYVNFEHKGTILRLNIEDMQHICVEDEINLLLSGETLSAEDNQAEIMFHQNGKTLYTFMRGKGIAYVIHVDSYDGSMSIVQRLELPGNDPRGAVFSPDCRFILVEGHNTNAIYTLNVDEDGLLSYHGQECYMSHPACLAFYKS